MAPNKSTFALLSKAGLVLPPEGKTKKAVVGIATASNKNTRK